MNPIFMDGLLLVFEACQGVFRRAAANDAPEL